MYSICTVYEQYMYRYVQYMYRYVQYMYRYVEYIYSICTVYVHFHI